MAKFFLIGIGGTGMRCLESFVHTCAMGMYDNAEIYMLALDTDANNGNFNRLDSLVTKYQAINGGGMKSDTFFSAKINYFKYSPAYTNQTFAKIADCNTLQKEDADFVNLFLKSDVMNMDLEHGYRAQTQMGSVLMYYAIQQAAYNLKYRQASSGLTDFLENLAKDANVPVFVFGSVFGGTGASSIPVIPLAINKALDIMGHSSDVLTSNKWGTIILTSYFSFNVHNENVKEVVARSENFAVNSQAALSFYNEDPTMAKTYRRMYLLGRTSQQNRDVTNGSVLGASQGVTGGAEQKNPADYIELISAFAAYHFFKEVYPDGVTANKDAFKNDGDRKFFVKASNFGPEDKIDFNLFTENDIELRDKMGSLVVASLLEVAHNFYVNITNQSNWFKDINADSARLKALREYFALFNIGKNEKGEISKGWLHQMYNGRGGKGILFGERLFQVDTAKMLSDLKPNKDIFVGKNPPKFDVPFLKSYFDCFKNTFSSIDLEKKNSFDDLIQRTYHTIQKLYFTK